MENFLKEILPYVYALLIAIIVFIVNSTKKIVIAYGEAKVQQVVNKIGADKYKQEKIVAYDIWGIVDEHFRITKFIGDSIQLKINMFNDLLLKKLPYLKQEDLDHLRQSVAGEVNYHKGTPIIAPFEEDKPTPTE